MTNQVGSGLSEESLRALLGVVAEPKTPEGRDAAWSAIEAAYLAQCERVRVLEGALRGLRDIMGRAMDTRPEDDASAVYERIRAADAALEGE